MLGSCFLSLGDAVIGAGPAVIAGARMLAGGAEGAIESTALVAEIKATRPWRP